MFPCSTFKKHLYYIVVLRLVASSASNDSASALMTLVQRKCAHWSPPLRCRHRPGEGVWLQWILGGSPRPVRAVRLHCHHEIWQRRRLWERDPRGAVHQPSLPGTPRRSGWFLLCFEFSNQYKQFKMHFTTLLRMEWKRECDVAFVFTVPPLQCWCTSVTLINSLIHGSLCTVWV